MDTFYSRIMQHIEKHAFKRGRFKGDAPADKRKRNRFWHRVSAHNDYAAVVFHHTEIIKAYPDGRIVLSFGNYFGSTTTTTAFNQSLFMFAPVNNPCRMWMGSVQKFSTSVLCLKTAKGATPCYEGMVVNGNTCELVSEPVAFKAKRIDPVKVEAFNEAMDRSGFRAMFPMIYATVEAESLGVSGGSARILWDYRNKFIHDYPQDVYYSALTNDSGDELVASAWQAIVVLNKYHSFPTWDSSGQYTGHKYKAFTKSETWTKIINSVKSGMKHYVPTDTFYVQV